MPLSITEQKNRFPTSEIDQRAYRDIWDVLHPNPVSSVLSVLVYQGLPETETSPLFSLHQAGRNNPCVMSFQPFAKP